MKDMLVFCAELITQPGQAFRRILSNPRPATLAALFAMGVIAKVVAKGLSSGGFAMGGTTALLGALLGAVLLMFVGGALLHLSAGLLGGEGGALDLLRISALIFFPNVVLPAFALAGGVALALAQLGVTAWQVVLLVVAVREVHRVEIGTAVAAVALPVIAIGVALPAAALFILGVGLLHL